MTRKTRLRSLAGAVVLSLTLVCLCAGGSPAHAEERARTTAIALLQSLPVTPEVNVDYERDAFRHWITTDGCTTREWVLLRQSIAGTQDECLVAGGVWFSRYDGVRTSSPSTFDIDHMVPLAEAWGSGASSWTALRRQDFANDLGYRPALIAVSASSNRSKGDRDPAEWMPPSAPYLCKYLRQWIGVKYRWQLSVDAVERGAIVEGLQGCAPAMTPPTQR